MDRFPHSEILGSIPICKSPKLIAAYHVLLRLWEPRHPPCTLSYFLLLYRLLLGIVCLYFEIRFEYCDLSIEIDLHLPLSSVPTSQICPFCCLLFNLTSSNMSKNVCRFEYRDLRFETDLHQTYLFVSPTLGLISHISCLLSKTLLEEVILKRRTTVSLSVVVLLGPEQVPDP